MDALLYNLPRLLIGFGILSVAIILGLTLTWIIKKLFNRVFSKPTFPDKFSHALLSTVMFVPGWIIILMGVQTALGVFSFRTLPLEMFMQFLHVIFAGGLILYLINALRRARV